MRSNKRKEAYNFFSLVPLAPQFPFSSFLILLKNSVNIKII